MILATPAIWYPGQSEAEWQEELDLMVKRSHVTSDFLQGKIAPDTFLDYLAEEYQDPLIVAEDWELWGQLGTFNSPAIGG
jgi:hypothetical protein